MRSWPGWGRSFVVEKNNIWMVGCLLVTVKFNLIWIPSTHLFLTLLELIDIFIGKAKVEKMSNDLKLKYGLLESAMSMVLQISGFFSKWRFKLYILRFHMAFRCFIYLFSHCSWKKIAWNNWRSSILTLFAHRT